MTRPTTRGTTRAVVVGAGIIGAACAERLARAGVATVVVDRAELGSGTTSRGEGNILVSDKGPGPELDLALLSRDRWLELGEELGTDAFELDPKGGLVVAPTSGAMQALAAFAERQRTAGIDVHDVEDPQEYEPHLAHDVLGARYYPQDMQVQPVLAAAALLDLARQHGADYRPYTEVAAPVLDTHGRLAGVRTTGGDVIGADLVINAAGTWGGVVSERLGAPVPVLPRRGFILVTEPVPPLVRHKVYSADYVDNVSSSQEALQTSCVVEWTRGGTILVGASRERVGFDPMLSPAAVARLASQAVHILPVLRHLSLLRVYRGFRPYCTDHLPVIGPDPRRPAVLHACGHEGAGIGLATGTAQLILEYATGVGELTRHFEALLPDRFAAAAEQDGSRAVQGSGTQSQLA